MKEIITSFIEAFDLVPVDEEQFETFKAAIE